MGLVSMPIVVYTFVSFQVDPFLKNWQTQNIITSPPFGDYLLAFGVAIVLGASAVWHMVRKLEWGALLLVTWVVIFPVLAYAPYNLQRRLPEGVWTAFVILALLGVSHWRPVWRKVGTGLLAVGMLSSLILFLGGLIGVTQPARPLFIPATEVEMFDALAENTPKGAVVLASYEVSNELPAWVPVTTLIGHGPESVRLAEIRPRVEAFVELETTDLERNELLEEFAVDYVVLEVVIIPKIRWAPELSEFLTLVYSNDQWKVFRVER
jgi:hypothetical protein